jgi:phosphate starvation-inducible PhoH-like protein
LEEGITIAFDNRELLSGICGANDNNLRIIEGSLGGFITARGNEIHFEGQDETGVKRFRTMMDSLIAAVEEGEEPSPDYIRALAGEFSGSGKEDLSFSEQSTEQKEKGAVLFRESMIQIPHGIHRIYPR